MRRNHERLAEADFLPGALVIGIKFQECFNTDPLLPPELLPRPWPGRRARELLARSRRLGILVREQHNRPALFAPFDDIVALTVACPASTADDPRDWDVRSLTGSGRAAPAPDRPWRSCRCWPWPRPARRPARPAPPPDHRPGTGATATRRRAARPASRPFFLKGGQVSPGHRRPMPTTDPLGTALRTLIAGTDAVDVAAGAVQRRGQDGGDRLGHPAGPRGHRRLQPQVRVGQHPPAGGPGRLHADPVPRASTRCSS